MAATVSAAKLQETINAKLLTATQCVFDLQQSEHTEINRYADPQRYAVDFLHAARGVYPVIEAFATAHMQPTDFKKWVSAWEAELSDSERDLWVYMRQQRINQEHGEGAEFIQTPITLTHGHMPQDYTNYALLGLERPPPPSKGGIRFKAYPDRPTSDVCREYGGLCRRFSDAFQRDYEYLMK